MTQQTYKNILKLFSLVVVLVGIYQTYTYQVEQINNKVQIQNNTTTNNHTNQSIDSNSSYKSGVSIYSTTQAQVFVKQALIKNGLTPIIRSYSLTGVEWIFNMALTYGHFVVALYIYSVFKNPQNPKSKKIKIVGIGTVVLFIWIYFSSRIGYQKIKVVSQDGTIIYHSQKAQQKHNFQTFLSKQDNYKLFSISDDSTLSSGSDETVKIKDEINADVNNNDEQPIQIVQDVQQIRLPQIDTTL